jgi:hypothetical protein
VFSYDPPQVTGVMPNIPDARGTEVVTFRGKNFGFDPTPLAITLNDVRCRDAEWLNDGLLRCRPEATVVGPKNISIRWVGVQGWGVVQPWVLPRVWRARVRVAVGVGVG